MVSCIPTARATLWMRGRDGIRSVPPSRRPITGCVVLARRATSAWVSPARLRACTSAWAMSDFARASWKWMRKSGFLISSAMNASRLLRRRRAALVFPTIKHLLHPPFGGLDLPAWGLLSLLLVGVEEDHFLPRYRDVEEPGGLLGPNAKLPEFSLDLAELHPAGLKPKPLNVLKPLGDPCPVRSFQGSQVFLDGSASAGSLVERDQHTDSLLPIGNERKKDITGCPPPHLGHPGLDRLQARRPPAGAGPVPREREQATRQPDGRVCCAT